MKIKKQDFMLTLVACLVFLFNFTLQEKKISVADAQKEIEGKNLKFADLFNRGDIKELSRFLEKEYFKEDATLYLPDKEIKGIKPLVDYWISLREKGVTNLKFKTRAIKLYPIIKEGGFDHIAFELGTLSFEIHKKEGYVLDPQYDYQNGWEHREDCRWVKDFGNYSIVFE